LPAQKYLIVEHLSTKDIAKLFSRIRIDPVTGCWNWTGPFYENGYGSAYFRQEQRREYAHRLLYAWLVEPLPRGRRRGIPVLDHVVCDSKPCCNPAHTKLGPVRDNVLRGNSPAAANTRKTHCPRGHLLPSVPNQLSGYTRNREVKLCRRCKACKTERYNEWVNGSRREQALEYKRTVQRRYIARRKLRLNPESLD
jgi:hypothetical protein